MTTAYDRHIVYFFDKGFEGCSLVSLHSVLRLTKGPLHVSLHPTEPMPHLARDVATLAARFPDAQLHLTEVDATAWAHIPAGPLPLTSRLRLLLPRLHAGRVLYIDGDTLARRDISPLVDFDMGGHATAGAPVPKVAIRYGLARHGGRRGRQAAEHLEKQSRALGGLDMSRYVNAGIMLFDLDKIVATGRDARMTDIAATKDYASRDQTFLNAIFNDDMALFDPGWNSGWGEARTANWYVPREVRDAFRVAREDPGLLHFKGREKPWHARTPPFRAHMLTQGRKRRLRAKFWAEYQVERDRTEALVGRALF